MSDQKIAIRRSRKHNEGGQTLVLVAVALVSLLGMAALAIDVTTLYVAKSELQRAADAAALAAAKTFVDSGVTSLNPGDPAYPTRQVLAQTMATQVIASVLAQNNVSGAAPTLLVATPDLTRPGNPQISVTLQRTNLPTFFARIWGTKLASVTATAVAEAYNPGNAAANYPPIAPKCVKPMLIANRDPATGTQLVNAATGAPVATNVIGEAVTLAPCASAACPQVAGNLQFLPAQVNPGTANLCPGTCSPPASDYETSIDCCDSANPPATQYVCGTPAPAPPVNVNAALVNPQLSTETNNGLQCVTNHPSPDTLDPADLQAGTGPPKITAGSGPQVGNFVTTSRAIVTLPIIESLSTVPLHVVGFVQVFVDPVTVNTPTSTPAHILNVIGCGNSPGAGPPVLGGGYSPIPVRLIH